MASTTTTSRYALLLVALFHASLCWDASNIWFPDSNNPLFYNMTFYQQAGQVADTESPSENLVPPTEAPPRKTNWQRPRPNVFNVVEETPVRPTDFEAPRPRPNVFNMVEETPVRPTDFEVPRPRPNVFNMVEETPVRPTDFEAQRPRPTVFRPVVVETPVKPTEIVAQRPRPNVFRPVVVETPVRPTEIVTQRPRPNVFRPVETPVRPTEIVAQRPRPNVFRPVVVEPPVRPTETYASVVGRRTRPTTPDPERSQFNQNRQPSRPQAGVKGGSQSGSRRITNEQEQFNRNQQNRQPIQNPGSFPDIAVGYKTFPLTEETPVINNNRRNQQSSNNRLRRTEYEGVADGRNYFGNSQERTQRQFPEQQRWASNGDAFLSGPRQDERLEATNNGIGSERSFGVPVEGNGRNWNTGTPDRAPINPVEENVITDLETSSKATGPSKCVWAIISCCKPTSSEIRYMCFEALGCHGAFWDTNPCSREMTLAAVQATANFYKVPRTQEEEEED